MRTIFLFFLIATMFFSCKKDNIPLPDVWKGLQTYGYAKAKRNGQNWEGSSGWTYATGDSSKIHLLVNTFDIVDLDTTNIELLGINNILTKVADYKMEEFENARQMRLPFATYETGFLDEIDAVWVNNVKYSSSLTIESFDSVTATIKGRFNLTFKKIDNYGLAYPSKVTFEDGTFEARYVPPPQ